MKLLCLVFIVSILFLFAFSGCIQPPAEENGSIPQPPALPDSGKEDETENTGGETIPQPPALPD